MKIFIRLTFLVVFALFVSSCDSEDNDHKIQAQLIVGTWELYEVDFNENYFLEDEVYEETISLSICDTSPLYVFSDDGSFSISNFGIDLREDISCEMFGEVSGTWEYDSGNTFILDSGNEIVSLEVTFSNEDNHISIKQTDTDVDGTYEYTLRGNRM